MIFHICWQLCKHFLQTKITPETPSPTTTSAASFWKLNDWSMLVMAWRSGRFANRKFKIRALPLFPPSPLSAPPHSLAYSPTHHHCLCLQTNKHSHIRCMTSRCWCLPDVAPWWTRCRGVGPFFSCRVRGRQVCISGTGIARALCWSRRGCISAPIQSNVGKKEKDKNRIISDWSRDANGCAPEISEFVIKICACW